MKLHNSTYSGRDSFFDRKKTHPGAGNHSSWAVSYVDLLTLLLCFFVMFYSDSKKNLTKLLPREKILKTIAAEMPAGMTATPTDEPGVYEVRIENLSFFDTGSTELLPGAREKVNQLIEKLRANQDHLHITVQGHSDSRNVLSKQRKFADNWELSVLRATSVLKLFAEQGYPQDGLSAEGFSSTRFIASDVPLENQRRVTLRIEER